MTDEELLAASERDRAAFGEFYERTERGVLGFFGAATRSADLAADLTAETFAAALSSVGRFDPQRGSARVWLFGIARHVLAQSARRGRVDSEARRRLGFEVLVIEREQLDAIAELIERDGDQIVDEWLALLPDEQAQALQARVLDGRSYDEIAEQLRCSQAVVRQRVSRGLGRLRREVRKEAA
jgi:RNA polymerase sigma-70 factor (ECF subfamily)